MVQPHTARYDVIRMCYICVTNILSYCKYYTRSGHHGDDCTFETLHLFDGLLEIVRQEGRP